MCKAKVLIVSPMKKSFLFIGVISYINKTSYIMLKLLILSKILSKLKFHLPRLKEYNDLIYAFQTPSCFNWTCLIIQQYNAMCHPIIHCLSSVRTRLYKGTQNRIWDWTPPPKKTNQSLISIFHFGRDIEMGRAYSTLGGI